MLKSGNIFGAVFVRPMYAFGRPRSLRSRGLNNGPNSAANSGSGNAMELTNQIHSCSLYYEINKETWCDTAGWGGSTVACLTWRVRRAGSLMASCRLALLTPG